jgi:geranylgeranylglycerol-phosphate geranylgeranyltransferase
MAKEVSLSGRLVAILKLTRIEHSLMLVIAVMAAELDTVGLAGLPKPSIIALSVITPIFLSMASFAINDYFDIETDRANRRFERPLVSGAISPQAALGTAIISFLVGVIASFFINFYAFVLAIVFGAMAFMYSYRLKDTLLLGNVYIALSMVVAFIYGDLVVSDLIAQSIIIISIIIFLSGLAREIHGMIRDYEGDAKVRKMKGLVHYIGVRKSAVIALVLYTEAVVISIFAFFFYQPFLYNALYIAPILVADAALMYVAVGYVDRTESGALRGSMPFFKSARNISLGAMSLALLAYLIAPLNVLI